MTTNNLTLYTPISSISEANERLETRPDMNTGRYNRVDIYNSHTNLYSYSLPSSELFDSPPLRNISGTAAMPNPADLTQQTPMSGRTTLQYPTHDSNSETWHSRETARSIGMLHGNPQRKENSTISPLTCASPLTTPYAELPRTIWSPSPWNDNALSTGEKLAQENHAVHGTKLDGTHTPKFQVPNSGMAIMDRIMSSSTNSLDRLELNTYSDGAIDTPCPSRQKVQPLFLGQRKSGSPATSTLENGIRKRLNLKRKLCYDD